MIKGNRGQLSIFMGITLIIVMGMLAFIINVGLFVKAKINLQNATDAAAFSGAAVQARQLTNIAYANWELRNTYKEWMFKYYVLGQLGLYSTTNPPNPLQASELAGSKQVRFQIPTPPIAGLRQDQFDKYNLPSICIHNNSKTNICAIYALPGIPRFDSIGIAGISEIHESFVDSLVKEKGQDCSRRSKLNYLTALTWAFGSGSSGPPDPEVPLVATNRPGAWPESVELAIRIRNLEMIVNRPALANINRSNVNQLSNEAPEIGFNERPIKAYWSAYRNLGGGKYKDGNSLSGGSPEKFTSEFSLTELPPTPFNAKANGDSVSSFLIPDNATYPSGPGSPLNKQYLDLQLMPINYTTLFSTFVSMAQLNTAIDTQSEATCGVSKTAMPVPGYILGFNKNPEVITYYAVKGETKFVGLFFPVNGAKSDGFKLTAYAAAKPFGGRIGPKLFTYVDGQTVRGREDADNKSAPYVSGLKIQFTSAAGFVPGMPIPSSNSFWVDETDAVGGVPGTSNTTLKFGIPNMIYDFEFLSDLDKQKQSNRLQIIAALDNINFKPRESLGMYNSTQLRLLKESIGPLTPGTSMSGDAVFRSIIRARRPTKYDAMNYLIPDFREVNNKGNAAPFIQKLRDIPNADKSFSYKLFAPLVGPNLLYKTPAAVESVINVYLDLNRPSVKTYMGALLNVAKGILANPTKTGTNTNIEAAQSIHTNALSGQVEPDLLIEAPAGDPGCKTDIASKFFHFFVAEKAGCGVVPLRRMMIDFIADRSKNENGFDRSMYYEGFYYNDPNSSLMLAPDQLMSAYFPGIRQGITPQAIAEHPLKLSSGSDSYSARRNYYSTKFFQMAKIIDSPPVTRVSTRGKADYEAEPALRESNVTVPQDLQNNISIKNSLKYDASTGINNIYYLDF